MIVRGHNDAMTGIVFGPDTEALERYRRPVAHPARAQAR